VVAVVELQVMAVALREVMVEMVALAAVVVVPLVSPRQASAAAD
jgi:hypothetical protein